MDISNHKFLNTLKSLYFIQEISLFGSRARGDAREKSDIDIAITYDEYCPKKHKIVEEIIENADTLLKIDLVVLNNCKQAKLLQNIQKEKVILYERENTKNS